MKFTKMHGSGHDYILMNCMDSFPDDPAGLSEKLSNRHFGVGGDGLICICPSEKADFYMRMFNADGSEGAMCGNGIRCAAKYVFEKRLTNKECISFETPAGVRVTELHTKHGEIHAVSVDMGKASTGEVMDIDVKGKYYTGVGVQVGNPHFVIPVPDVEMVNVQGIGASLQRCDIFPGGINVEFVKVLCKGEIKVRVWERGSGETMACGTGACAAAAVMSAMGRTDRQVTVHMQGGDLAVTCRESDQHLILQGPAETVFEGSVCGTLW